MGWNFGPSASGPHWQWQPDAWKWTSSPAGRAVGLDSPATVGQFYVTTAEIAADQRFDFWRSFVDGDFDISPPKDEPLDEFEGSARCILGARGSIELFHSSAVDGDIEPAHAKRGAPGLFVGLALKGERRQVLADETVSIARPGDFFVLDASRPSRVGWTDNYGIELKLSRRDLRERLGRRDAVSAESITQALATSPLSVFLRAQLRQLARQARHLSLADWSSVYGITFDLVGTILRNSLIESEPEATTGRALSLAAAHYIDRKHAVPELDADHVARALGCSRATLYRAFAEQGTTVAEVIRGVRLAHACHLLVTMPHLPISEIAVRCGLPEPRTFNRLFLQSSGMTPRDYRQSALSSAGHVTSD